MNDKFNYDKRSKRHEKCFESKQAETYLHKLTCTDLENIEILIIEVK